MKKLGAAILGAVFASALLALPAPLAQAQVTLGQLAPGTAPAAACNNSPFDLIPGTVATGNGYVAPVGGVITSWSTNAAAGAGQELDFKIFRPLGAEKFLVLARDSRSLHPAAVNVFKVSIPVQAGDLIGDQDANASAVHNACDFETGNASNATIEVNGDVPPGGVVQNVSSPSAGYVPNVIATLLPPPAIASLAPSSVSVQGGSSVTISGSNFAEVSAVMFGSAPAKSYTVTSEGTIAAVAPASKALGAVGVTVTTVAGTAVSPTTLTYTGCVVPRLAGKKLKAAQKSLKKADCKLGKVTKKRGSTVRSGRVTKESPKPGRLLAPGTKVKLTLAG